MWIIEQCMTNSKFLFYMHLQVELLNSISARVHRIYADILGRL